MATDRKASEVEKAQIDKAVKIADAAMLEAESMDMESLKGHYIAAIANWNIVLDERDELEKELAAVRSEAEQKNQKWIDAESEMSVAYMRVREALKDYGSYKTLPGGADRFDRTEQAIEILKHKAEQQGGQCDGCGAPADKQHGVVCPFTEEVRLHAIGEQQGEHVARCGCHDDQYSLICSTKHGHPFRDPRCGESIELIKAKARLEALENVAAAIPELWRMRAHQITLTNIADEARAEVEKLEGE